MLEMIEKFVAVDDCLVCLLWRKQQWWRYTRACQGKYPGKIPPPWLPQWQAKEVIIKLYIKIFQMSLLMQLMTCLCPAMGSGSPPLESSGWDFFSFMLGGWAKFRDGGPLAHSWRHHWSYWPSVNLNTSRSLFSSNFDQRCSRFINVFISSPLCVISARFHPVIGLSITFVNIGARN